MSRGRIRGVVAILLIGAALGCSRSSPSAEQGIRYGFDSCSYCKMTISESTWASVAVGPNGDQVRFDDLGCLASYLEANPGAWRVRVHTVDTDAWMDVSEVWFSRRPDRITPMGSGWSAYATRSAAGADGVTEGPLEWGAFQVAVRSSKKSLPGAESGAATGESEQVSN